MIRSDHSLDALFKIAVHGVLNVAAFLFWKFAAGQQWAPAVVVTSTALWSVVCGVTAFALMHGTLVIVHEVSRFWSYLIRIAAWLSAIAMTVALLLEHPTMGGSALTGLTVAAAAVVSRHAGPLVARIRLEHQRPRGVLYHESMYARTGGNPT